MWIDCMLFQVDDLKRFSMEKWWSAIELSDLNESVSFCIEGDVYMVGHRTKFYTVMISFFFFLLLSLSLVLLVLIVAVVLAIIRQKKIELSLTQRLLLLSSSLINGKAFVLALNGVFIQRKNSYTLNWFHYFLFQVI